jgi:DNA replication protein DnaC
MNLPTAYWNVTLDGVTKGTSQRKVTERFLRKMGDAFVPGQPMERGFGIFFNGKNDVGKTGAACVILKEARRRGFSCLFVRADALRSLIMSNTMFNDAHTWKQRAEMVDLLVIDDLGKEVSGEKSAGGSERLFGELLRERDSNNVSTLITTNTLLSDFQKRYKSSMMHLLSQKFVNVEADGPSLRKENQQQLIDFFKKR